MAARKSLQLGENTIQVRFIGLDITEDVAKVIKSFIAAANLGASYVEVSKHELGRLWRY